jgi:hypothetical protein
MTSKAPRTNVAISWNVKSLEAFYLMSRELGADTASDLGRQIFLEVMRCHFGLERSKELGIISAIAMSIPRPMYVEYAARMYSEAEAQRAAPPPSGGGLPVRADVTKAAKRNSLASGTRNSSMRPS